MKLEDVSIVVIPRERFSMARESLESLFANTPDGYRLIYVDGNSTPDVREYLDSLRGSRPLTVISTDYYLPNNRSRNLGLREVRTPMAVIVDNDLVFAPGWLETMLRCADETGADVVAPLTCEGYPAHTTIHYAGGEYVPADELDRFHRAQGGSARVLREKQYLLKQPLAQWRHTLRRGPTGFCEPHCILVRMSTLQLMGDRPFDEAMLATKEHLDFCMSVRAAGGSIVFEPDAVVTFMLPNPARPLQLRDWPFYLLRWSDDWQQRSLDHFVRKWQLGATDFTRRRLGTGYRREDLLRRHLRSLPLLGRSAGFIELAIRGLRRCEKFANRCYVDWYRRHHPLAC